MAFKNYFALFILAQEMFFCIAYDPKDLSGFLNAVAAPAGPKEPEMFCPGLCNPICSPACTLSCCTNSPHSHPSWENIGAEPPANVMQMTVRRSQVPDPTREQTKTMYGCESKQLSINCENRSNKLIITDAFYGRDETNVCKHPVLPYEAFCRGEEDLILKKVQNLCNGENQCTIAVKDGLLVRKETVLCPNVYKYLKVEYICTQHPDLYDKDLE